MILESGKTTLILVVLILALLVLAAGRLKSFTVSGSNPAKVAKEKNVGSDPDPGFTKQEQGFSKKGKASILFGGDMMFDRYIRQVIERKGFDYVLGDVRSILHSVDFVVANLEGPITDNESKSVGSEFGSRENYIFTFPKGTARELFANNITVVNIGNNHVLNFGQAGLEQNRQALKEAKVKYFGDPVDAGYASYVKEHNGIKIGLACFDQFSENGAARAFSNIGKLEKEADVIILYAHWGNEYETHSNQKQRDLAHQFVDAGADLVIGSHPHVIQETETYKGKRIYYSLGNFIFDQYFKEETKNGLLVKTLIGEGGIESFEEIEIGMDASGKTSIAKK